MTWVLAGAVAWLICALVAALVVVRAIRTADVRERNRRHRANFVVDEFPGGPAANIVVDDVLRTRSAAPPMPRREEPPTVRGTGAPSGSPSGPSGSSR